MSATKAESPVRAATTKKPQRRAADNDGDKAAGGADKVKSDEAKVKKADSGEAGAKKADSREGKVKRADSREGKVKKSDSREGKVKKAKTPEEPAKAPEPAPTVEAPKPEAAPAPEAPKSEARKKPGSSSDPDRKTKGARRPRPVPVKSGPPVVLIALVLAVFAGAGVGGALYVAQSPPPSAQPVASTQGAVAPASETPAPPPAANPAALPVVDTNGPVIAAALRELGAGREREALDLLAACKTTPEVEGVRERIQLAAREALREEGEKLKRIARSGRDPAPQLAKLRTRLPENLKGELDKLAVALKRELAGGGAAAEPEEPTASTTRTRLRPDQRPGDPADREPNPAKAEEAEEPAPLARAEPREEPKPAPGKPEAPRTRNPPPPPAPAPAPARKPEPEPEPAPASEPASEPAPSDEGPSQEEQADAVLKAALAEVLHVPHTLRGGAVDVNYGFDSDAERLDFEMRGFDKAEINPIYGAVHSGSTELELGAGSRGTGKLQHCLDLAGDFEIDMTVWTAHSGGRSQFFISIGRVGVRWGEQLIKVSKSGGMKPLGPEPDRMSFREERDVTIRLVRKGDELTVSMNGRTVAKKTFDASDLNGRLGIVCSDVRIVVTNLRIRGAVDATKL